jgi:hypothetical protein
MHSKQFIFLNQTLAQCVFEETQPLPRSQTGSYCHQNLPLQSLNIFHLGPLAMRFKAGTMVSCNCWNWCHFSFDLCLESPSKDLINQGFCISSSFFPEGLEDHFLSHIIFPLEPLMMLRQAWQRGFPLPSTITTESYNQNMYGLLHH